MNARITPAPARNDLDAFWMPFTANRQFKANPRLLTRAEGMHYWTTDGRQAITEAVTRQLTSMDYAPAFQMGHPIAFQLANRLAEIAPPGLERVFFTNSGSESLDMALKIATSYHR